MSTPVTVVPHWAGRWPVNLAATACGSAAVAPLVVGGGPTVDGEVGGRVEGLMTVCGGGAVVTGLGAGPVEAEVVAGRA